MLQCTCLCEKVCFEVEAMPHMVFNCHCNRCRKFHGAAFSTQVLAHKESVKFMRGKEFMREFKSPQAIRSFCIHCGSPLMNYSNGSGDYLSVPISMVNKSEDLRPKGECFTGEKLKFVTLDESIPHHAGIPLKL